MHAEIISVGTEMTTGAMLDTNSQWLSLELAAIGIPVHFHTTVADNLDAMAGVILRAAADRSDLVLLTGGLGPDARRPHPAGLGRRPRHRAGARPKIRSISSARSLPDINREMPERNVIQAYFPRGSQPIPNPRGTAPGIWAEIPRAAGRPACLFAAMPGVPHEMKRMFLKEVVPRLPGGNRVIQRARLNCFGVGESKAEEMLGDLTARGRDPEIGITVHEATITLRIVAHGETADECGAKIAAGKAAIRERMGEQVFGEEDEELEHVVAALLAKRGSTMATVEIGTGGLLARRITEVPNYEARVSRRNRRRLAGGSGRALGSSTSGDKRATIVAAIESCRERLGADFAVFVGAFPHFDPDNAAEASPTSEVALVGPNVSRVVDYTFLGDAALNRSRAGQNCLNLLRLHFQRS